MRDAHALSPLGGYKGQGLAMMVSLLTAALTGESLDWELEHIGSSSPDRSRHVAHLLICINPSAFVGTEAFENRLRAILDTTRATAPAGSGQVLSPGDPERLAAADNETRGIVLDRATAELMRRLAVAHHVDFEGATRGL
jgi:LDH2 family malate/lactate/ureidoglycolate dehydrogenase